MVSSESCTSRRMLARVGVSIVLLCLLIAPAHGETGDDRIRQRVVARLTGQVAIDFERLQIEVIDGAAHLRGSVASVGEREKASRIVSGIVGVRVVVNRLGVRGSSQSDQALRQAILDQLSRRPRFRPNPIDVSVVGARVTLRGQVHRALDRLDAGRAAAGVVGIVAVSNQIQVASAGAVSPEFIMTRARSILTNPLTFGVIRNLSLRVEGSTIVLGGTVIRGADREEAERLVLSVPGVSRVVNQIGVLGS